MSFSRTLIISTALFTFSGMAVFAQAPAVAPAAGAPAIQTPAAGNNAPITRTEIPALVKEALMNDPDMVMQAIQKLREKQEAEAKKKQKDGLVKYKDDLFSDDSPAIGDAKTADVTIVEFFDYHCGYCKHLLPELTKLVGEDKKLRVIFKEFPILSEDSVTAARAALAVNRIAKDKYFDFHSALMKTDGKFDEKKIMEVAKKLGINTTTLKAEMEKKEITAILDKNREIGENIGVRGTPAIVMGDELMPGAMSYDDMKKAVGNLRAGKQASAAAEAPTPATATATAPASAPTPAPVATAPVAPSAPAAAPAQPAIPAQPAAPTPAKN